ncbi:dehydratase [Halorhabdus sp. CBA1104]|uniref:MaoC/PaaZ C-terminal domain-containing protein n=1 Tax=unclassified Halorhabdus TaxID=2621901 RepID=UPI0012B3D2B0|nr:MULTISPECIES: MaoC/PaaZ C-terminal domain-containing protein [unclassified Halorhabdus]QGN07294.1 dehydratase [Halorhabdus sp. CBA1104]
MTRYFEDFAVGDRWTAGPRTVSAEEIVTFAEQFDPLPMHVEGHSEGGMFDGLIASGWHTGSLTMRLVVDGVLADSAVRAGLGVDDLRWPTPVEPGEELTAEIEVVGVEEFDDECGRVDLRVTTTNQHGDVVLSMLLKGLFGRRAAPA